MTELWHISEVFRKGKSLKSNFRKALPKNCFKAVIRSRQKAKIDQQIQLKVFTGNSNRRALDKARLIITLLMDKGTSLQCPANKIPTELDKSLNVNTNRSLKRPVNAKLGKLSLLFPRLVRIYLSLSFCKGKCGSSYLFLQSSADEQIRWTNCWNGRGVYIPLCGNSSLKIVPERMSPRLNSSEVIIFSSVPMEMFLRSAYYWQILKGFSRTKAISSRYKSILSFSIFSVYLHGLFITS